MDNSLGQLLADISIAWPVIFEYVLFMINNQKNWQKARFAKIRIQGQ